MALQMFIVNKSGSLIFNKDLSPLAPNVSSDNWLRLASTFHSLHAIISQAAPVPSGGIEKIETDTIKMQCLTTLTGMKIVITASPGTGDLDNLLQNIYELFSDYVLKDPFYEIEQPVRSELFNKHLDALFQRYTISPSKRRVP